MRTSRALLEVLINTVTHRRCPLAPTPHRQPGLRREPPPLPTHVTLPGAGRLEDTRRGSPGTVVRGTKGCASGSSPRARTGSQTGAPSWSIVGSRRSAAATGVAAAGRTPSQHQHGAADAEEVCGHPLGAGWALCPWLCIPRDITAPARRAAPPAVEQGQAAGGGGEGAPCAQLGATVHTQHPCVQSCRHTCVVAAQLCIHCCLQRAPSPCTHAAQLHALHAQTCKLAARSVVHTRAKGPWDTCGAEGSCGWIGRALWG